MTAKLCVTIFPPADTTMPATEFFVHSHADLKGVLEAFVALWGGEVISIILHQMKGGRVTRLRGHAGTLKMKIDDGRFHPHKVVPDLFAPAPDIEE